MDQITKTGTIRSQRRGWATWMQAPLTSALLLWMSFPPLHWSWLSFVALVPLFTLIRKPWRKQPIYRPAWIAGFVWALLSVHWLRYSDDRGPSGWFGWIALALYMAFYFPVFLALARMALLRLGLPGFFALPVIWVGLEYLRGWLFTGFPWYFLAHSLYRWTSFIQIADIFGAYGVSFMVVLVNAWLYELLSVPLMTPARGGSRISPQQRWRLFALSVLVACWYGYGVVATGESALKPGPTVTLLQTNIAQSVKADVSQTVAIHRHYRRLIDAALREPSSLLIWPETAYRYDWKIISDSVTDADLAKFYPTLGPEKVQEFAKAVPEDLRFMTRLSERDNLIGLNIEQVTPEGVRLYNSAIVVDRDGEISEPYHKINLVPWGEYMPLRDWVPFLHVLTPHASANYGLTPGTSRRPLEFGDFRVGPLICFEDTMPAAARELMASDIDFLVNISNDGWFLDSAEIQLHLAAGLFRAVECRRSLVRTANISVPPDGQPRPAAMVIDGNGRIAARASAQDFLDNGDGAVVLTAEVPLDSRNSLYIRWGDWFAIFCLGSIAVIAGLSILNALTRIVASRFNAQRSGNDS